MKSDYKANLHVEEMKFDNLSRYMDGVKMVLVIAGLKCLCFHW